MKSPNIALPLQLPLCLWAGAPSLPLLHPLATLGLVLLLLLRLTQRQRQTSQAKSHVPHRAYLLRLTPPLQSFLHEPSSCGAKGRQDRDRDRGRGREEGSEQDALPPSSFPLLHPLVLLLLLRLR